MAPLVERNQELPGRVAAMKGGSGITSEARATGGLHSYSLEETAAFSEIINTYLGASSCLDGGELPCEDGVP